MISSSRGSSYTGGLLTFDYKSFLIQMAFSVSCELTYTKMLITYCATLKLSREFATSYACNFSHNKLNFTSSYSYDFFVV